MSKNKQTNPPGAYRSEKERNETNGQTGYTSGRIIILIRIKTRKHEAKLRLGSRLA